jgi:hypothetical protein
LASRIAAIMLDGSAMPWRTMRGTSVRLPAVADEGGPADRITLDDEFEVHTWLSSFLVKDAKAHFLYLAQTNPPRQHYVRYDLKTARREVDLQPEFKGRRLSLRGLDGFLATRSGEGRLDPLLHQPRGQQQPPRLSRQRRQRHELARLRGQRAGDKPLFHRRLPRGDRERMGDWLLHRTIRAHDGWQRLDRRCISSASAPG